MLFCVRYIRKLPSKWSAPTYEQQFQTTKHFLNWIKIQWLIIIIIIIIIIASSSSSSSSSLSSDRLEIQRSGFDSRRYQIFWEVVGLERGPLRLVGTTEELLGRKCSGSGLENKDYGHGDPSRWQRGTLYPQKLASTSPTIGGRWVGIIRSRTQAMEFSYFSLASSSFKCALQYIKIALKLTKL
jgi:hypothetical protein